MTRPPHDAAPDGAWLTPGYCSDCQEAPCACPTVTDYEKAIGRIAELEEDLEDLSQNYELRAAELADAVARLADRERMIADLERKLAAASSGRSGE